MKSPLLATLFSVSLTLVTSGVAYGSPGFGSTLELRSNARESRGEGPFRVPSQLRGRVDFWKDIFSKYGRRQVVIHHREFPQVVFGVLDFSAEAESMSEIELERHKDRVERETLASMRQQIKALVAGGEAETPFQKSFVEKMEVVPEESRSYARVLDEDLIRTQSGIRERYAEAISRAWRYLPVMEEIFASEYGLPRELTRLPFIESSFDYTAYSSVGAAGIWQFMPRTARSHRMLVGRHVDERRDPVKATRAAAEYLRLAYQELGSWPLAITSYNHGVGGVRSKVRQAGTANIAEIIEHPSKRFLGFASTNFYPEFLAAVEIFEDHETYFPEVAVQPPLRVVAYPVKTPMSTDYAARQLGVSLESLKEANYALLDPVWRGSARIPAGYILQVPVQYSDKTSGLRTPEPIRSRIVPISEARHDGVMYRVSRGDTLDKIAVRYNTTPSHLIQTNRLSSRAVSPGQVLWVPAARSGDGGERRVASLDANPEIMVQAVENPAPVRSLGKGSATKKTTPSGRGSSSGHQRYKVKRGDNLLSIAHRYKCSVGELKRLNNIRGEHLQAGQLLRLPE